MYFEQMASWIPASLGSELGGYVRILNTAGTFDPTQGTYSLKLTIQSGGYSAHFQYEITTTTGYMPALRVDGFYNCCPFSGFENEYATRYNNNLILAENEDFNITNRINATLVTSSGDTDRFSSIRAVGQGVLFGYGADSSEVIMTIDADFPIFGGNKEIVLQTANADYYGWADADIIQDYIDEIIDENDTTHIEYALNGDNVSISLIDNDKIYYCYSSLKVDGVITETHAYQFKIDKAGTIALVADLPHDNTQNTNVTLRITKAFQYRQYPNGAWVSLNSMPDTIKYYWFNDGNSWTDLATGSICSASMARNIPMFTNTEDAEIYEDTGDDSASIGGGGDFGTKESTIGSSLDSSDIPSVVPALSGVGSYIYVLSDAELQDVMTNCLYNTNQTVVDSIKDGLWLWGNNPIDFLIDIYYVPFNISYFYTLNSASMKFGSYVFAGTSYSIVDETSGNRITLFNTLIDPLYSDWRDYTFVKYDLYLPYIGFVSLDPNLYVGKYLKCEMMFDITTHNLRYYLYVNGVIAERFDGSVGLNMPLMATDQVNKAKMDVQNAKNSITSAISAGANLATGNIGGAIGGIMDFAQSASQVAGQKPTENVVGGYSSSMNIYDIRYAYLKITQTNHITPHNLNLVYNQPSYYIGYLNNLSGYCELEDVQLVSSATETEQAEIKALLRGGVIF